MPLGTLIGEDYIGFFYSRSFRTQDWQKRRIVQAINRTQAADANLEKARTRAFEVFNRVHGPSPKSKSLIKSYFRLLEDSLPGLLMLDLTEDGRVNTVISGPGKQVESH